MLVDRSFKFALDYPLGLQTLLISAVRLNSTVLCCTASAATLHTTHKGPGASAETRKCLCKLFIQLIDGPGSRPGGGPVHDLGTRRNVHSHHRLH